MERSKRSGARIADYPLEMMESSGGESEQTTQGDTTLRKRASFRESMQFKKKARSRIYQEDGTMPVNVAETLFEHGRNSPITPSSSALSTGQDLEGGKGKSLLFEHGRNSPITPSSSVLSTGQDLEGGKGKSLKQFTSQSENRRDNDAKRRKQSNTYDTSATKGISLVEIIKYNTKLVGRAAKAWVERYEADQNSGLIELITSVFEACGTNHRLDDGPLDETDVDEVVLNMVTNAKDGFLEDYLGSKQRELRNFKDNLLHFWDVLVLECQGGPLFDGLFMEKCMDYVIALSCTPPRVFRQVTTLVGLQLVTSLVAVAKTLGESRETVQRQFNAEKRKKKDGPRVESLNKLLSETHEKITKAEEMMRKIFTGLFILRYRDVDPDIRVECIRALGSWIVSYPSLFLQDSYLKYIGWTLNDKNPAVRKTSIEALQNLYEIDDNVPSLGLFTERFCKRMIEMADDLDISVAVSAIHLLKQLLRHQLLGDEYLSPLYDLLIDESPLIRRAIGDLVYDHLIAQKFSGSEPNDNETSGVQLQRILHILREFSSEPILINYVIDAVWEEMKAMKDWKCMTSMLLDDNPKTGISDEDGTNLVRVLCASVKKAVGDRIVPSTEPRKLNLSKLQKEVVDNDKKELTVVLMKTLPKLLRKYLADKEKIAAIVELIIYMNLELYSLKRQEQTFTQVLKLIKDAFLRHGEDNILKACMKVLSFCCSESQADLQDSAQQIMKLVEDELILKLRNAIKQAGDSDDEYSVTVNLRRFHQLQSRKMVCSDALFMDMVSLLENYNDLDDEVIQLTIMNMFLHIAWCFRNIETDSLDDATMLSLTSKRTSLINQIERFAANVIQSPGSRSLLGCTICVILSDLWSLFSETKLKGTKLQILGFQPSASSLEKFWKLCEQKLNSPEEEDEVDDVTEVHHNCLDQKDVVMAAAAKLIAHDLVSKEFLGAQVISHFVLHGKAVTEIVKHLLVMLKKNMKMENLANLYLEAIIAAYKRHEFEFLESEEDWSISASFSSCKELASRLSATFLGSARNMYRSSILRIVKEGIEYAFVDVPKHLPFLECGVLQFALKLPSLDLQEILANVQSKVEGMNTDEDPSRWRSYCTFRDFLKEKASKSQCADVEKEGSGLQQLHARTRNVRGSSGKRLFHGNGLSDDDDDENDEERVIHSGEDNDADDTPLRHSRKQTYYSHQRVSRGRVSETLKEEEVTRRSYRKGTESSLIGSLGDEVNIGSPMMGSATEEQLPMGHASQFLHSSNRGIPVGQERRKNFAASLSSEDVV